MRFDDLSCRARELINDIQEHHRIGKYTENEAQTHVRQKYAELIELIREMQKPDGVTHFKITRSGDVVFVNNASRFGQSFKRLWSLHLPLC